MDASHIGNTVDERALRPTPPPRFDALMFAHEQLCRTVEANLLEIYNLDPQRFDTQFPHMRKTHLPRRVVDPSGFTTFEAALAGNRPPIAPSINVAFSNPKHPQHRPMSDAQKACHYTEGGIVGLPRDRWEHYGVTAEDIRAAAAWGAEPAVRAMDVLPLIDGPQAWKATR